jgi:hypothetical protein
MLEQISNSVYKELPEQPQTNVIVRLLGNDWTAVALIGLFCFLAFGSALFGNFSSDDILHTYYAHKIFHGRPDLLLKELIAAWPDRSFHLHYRPGVELSYAGDYLLWQGNPFGYHLSNLLFHCVSTAFLFLTTRLVLAGNGRLDAHFIALTAALLFAVFPTHAEPVCWIAGRVDCLCGAFFFIALWSFVKHSKSNRVRLKTLSLATFAACLATKEMGACLPFVISLWSWFFDSSQASSFGARLRYVSIKTLDYWAVLAAFLLGRSLVLGNPLGGYSGAGADLVWRDLLPNLLHPHWLTTLAYPLRRLAADGPDSLAQNLQTIYILVGSTIIWKLLRVAPGRSDRRIIFFFAWMVLLSFLPVLPVFYISPLLQGGRFFYLPCASLMVLFTFALLGPGSSTKDRHCQRIVGLLLSGGLLFCFIAASQRNSSTWIDSGLQLHTLKSEIAAEIEHLPKEKQLVIVNLPNSFNGTHMFYLFEMLQRFVSPPFCLAKLSDRIAALEPVSFGQKVLLNKARLKEMISADSFRFCLWDMKRRRLQTLSQQQLASLSTQPSNWQVGAKPAQDLKLSIREIEFKGSGKSFLRQCRYETSLPIQPGHYDLLLLVATAKPAVNSKPFDASLEVSWVPSHQCYFGHHDPFKLALTADGKSHTYIVPLGEQKSWSLSEQIDGLQSRVKGRNVSVEIQSARLLSGKQYIPSLSANPSRFATLSNGLHRLKEGQARFDFDASDLPDAKGVIVELSKPFGHFASFTNTLRDEKSSALASAHMELNFTKGSFELPARWLETPAWYQVRLAAISETRAIIGYFSDPVYLQTPDYSGGSQPDETSEQTESNSISRADEPAHSIISK